jgi:hypothetical protein
MGAECSKFCTCVARVEKYAEDVTHRNEVASLPGERRERVHAIIFSLLFSSHVCRF